ncbi:hypothetical protein MNL01_07360 [Bartonella krasnovii]|uniref:hypothetical protein n=1 Tax=Bartonella krasnovii TaxID=2267275 RepID=UPI001F4CAADA|nr:hypothetical protein [Bartonella krasnovii]UNF53445.1 hypothetical protein MNL01_07360 [Bartonella krasnovii]
MIKYLALLGLLIIVILMFMVIIRLPYLLIKHMRVSFKLARELKKNTTQQKQAIQRLCNDWEEMKRQNLTHKTLEEKMRLLNFKESLPLYAKECKIIFSILILISLLQIAFSIAKLVWWKDRMVSFIMPLSTTSIIYNLTWVGIFLVFPIIGVYNLTWVGIFLVFPIIGVMGIKLTRKLRETLLKLDEAIEQRDQAIRVQNAQSEKEQGETK